MFSILSFEQKINAPTLAFKTLYGKYPAEYLRGREFSHKTYTFKGIQIDSNIPRLAFKKLLNIKDIETRSSCEGQDERHPTFLIFRLKRKHDKNQIKEIVKKLNKYSDIRASYDIGAGGMYRICVTSNLWFGKDNFKSWWLKLPNRIQKSI